MMDNLFNETEERRRAQRDMKNWPMTPEQEQEFWESFDAVFPTKTPPKKAKSEVMDFE